MKVIIAGGRNFKPTEKDFELLSALHEKYVFTEVVSGTCSGADKFGESFARKKGIYLRRFLPDWDRYGRAAGPIRNGEMARYADALILFPGGRGTESMRRVGKENRLEILHQPNEKLFRNNPENF